MTWIIASFVLFLVAIIVGFIGTFVSGEDEESKARPARGIAAYAVVLVIWLAASALMGIHKVDAGNVGVVYNFGKIDGQIDEGVTILPPWKTVKTQSIQVQRFSNNAEKDQPYVAFSKETQDVFIRATLNYSVSPNAVQNLYRTVGPNWFEKLVEPRIQNFLKEETVKYEATDIAPHREDLRRTVRDRLAEELKPYSISVQDFLLDNIDFDEQLKQSIVAKQVAAQQAQAAQNKVIQTEAEAQQTIARAKGDAEAKTIAAAAEASANSTIAKSLSPELLQYRAITQLADNIQIALVPSGQGIILDPSTLLKK